MTAKSEYECTHAVLWRAWLNFHFGWVMESGPKSHLAASKRWFKAIYVGPEGPDFMTHAKGKIASEHCALSDCMRC